jgi:transcriptional regulator with XRE-family HTH domain
MTLDAYLNAKSIKEADFAALLDVSQSTVNRLRRGSVPSKDLMAKIFAATGGAVRADDFFGIGAAA